jgi:hypothetical protein
LAWRTPPTGHTDAGRQQYQVARQTAEAALSNLDLSRCGDASNLDDDLRQYTTVSQKIHSQAGLADTVRSCLPETGEVWQRALPVRGWHGGSPPIWFRESALAPKTFAGASL